MVMLSEFLFLQLGITPQALIEAADTLGRSEAMLSTFKNPGGSTSAANSTAATKRAAAS